MQWLDEAGLDGLRPPAVPDEALRLVRTARYANLYYLAQEDEDAAVDRRTCLLYTSPGTVRVKFGGGHAGHNGLRSICDKLGTRDWSRVRVGIGRPPGRMPVVDLSLIHI